jgi:hypothetical protein
MLISMDPTVLDHPRLVPTNERPLLISEYGFVLDVDEGSRPFPSTHSTTEVTSQPHPDKGPEFIHRAKSTTMIFLK